MKTLVLSLAITSALITGVTGSAAAASWRSINERQGILEDRINEGIRNGALTRPEAIRLRAEFSDLGRMEETYRRSGGSLSAAERADLDRRFDALRLRIRVERHDQQDRGDWVPINQRQERIDERIEQGVRNGTLTRTEAIELRGEFRTLVNLEAEYRRSRGGLSADERVDLDRRLERLSARVAKERHDRAMR